MSRYKKDDHGNITIPSTLKRLPKECCYDGKPKVKRSDVSIEYEQWQVEELIKCKNDIVYFLSNYCYIIHPDKGKHNIDLYDFQHDFIKHLRDNRFSIVLAPRQCGKSTVTAMFVLHYILFNDDKKAVILANKLKIAKEIFQKVRVSFEMLPYWLQTGVVEWAKTSCVLENGSSCSAEATSADGLRGITGNLVVLDEMAFIKRNVADEFFTSMYPTVTASQEAKLIIISTPNGMNHFHEMWNKAVKKKSNFKAFKVEWNDVPGRDEEFKRTTISDIGKIRWNQEYACSFIGSSKTLIKGAKLELLESKEPIDTSEDYLKVYEEPRSFGNYVCGVDVAKGTGGDYSVINVIDITAFPFRQVAVYRNNEISTHKFADVIEKIALKYNEAFVMIENNDVGEAVVNKMWHEIEYENMVNWTPNKKLQRNELGIRATKKTKSLACDNLKDFVDEDKIEIVDLDTIYELSKFIEVKDTNGVFKAEDGEHDDCVTSLYWALFVILTNFVDKDDDIRANRNFEEEDENSDGPLEMINTDGTEDFSENWLTGG